MAAFNNDEDEQYRNLSKQNQLIKAAVKALAFGAVGGATGLGGGVGAEGVAEGGGMPGGLVQGPEEGTGEGVAAGAGSPGILDSIKNAATQADAAIKAPAAVVQGAYSPITSQLQGLVGSANLDKLIQQITKDPAPITDQRGIPSRIFDLVLRRKNPFNQDFSKENAQLGEASNRQKLAVLGQLMGAAGQLGGQEHQTSMQDSSFLQQKNMAYQEYQQNKSLLLQRNASAADLQALEDQYNTKQRALDQTYHQSNIRLGAEEQRTTNQQEQSGLTDELYLRGLNQNDTELSRMQRHYKMLQDIGGDKNQSEALNWGARASAGAESPIMKPGDVNIRTGKFVGEQPIESDTEMYQTYDAAGKPTGVGTRVKKLGGNPYVGDPEATKDRLAELMGAGPKTNVFGPQQPSPLNPPLTPPNPIPVKPTIAPTPFGLSPDVYKQALGLVGGGFTSKDDLKNQGWQKLAEALTAIQKNGATYNPGQDSLTIDPEISRTFPIATGPIPPGFSKTPLSANDYERINSLVQPDIERARKVHKLLQSLQ